MVKKSWSSYPPPPPNSVQVYHTKHTPTEQVVREASPLEGYNYAKLICNRADNERVVGLHYLGPNAGTEVIMVTREILVTKLLERYGLLLFERKLSSLV